MATAEGQKIHYICQSYEERKAGRDGTHLAIKGTFLCSDAGQAVNRAERAVRLSNCIGADAFSVLIDTDTGETDEPTFLARFGNVPGRDPI